jgi:ribosome-associated protein
MPKPAPKKARTTRKPASPQAKAPSEPSAVSAPTPRKGRASTKTSPSQAEAALALALAAARSLDGDKCADVLVLDLRGRSQMTDYFVIASGTSDRQMHSAADHVVDLASSMKERLYRSNLDEAKANWLILDFVTVVVHVLMPETRHFYDLEMLWGDAPRLEWSGARPAAAPVIAGRNRAGLTAADVLPGRRAR